ncbi:baseplate assembly protein, partial [Yersinia enterocolitica]
MMYLGMNAQTGRRITDMDHITQSITDIVTTPTTTRCMRRGYGSLLSDLIDDPQNPVLRLKA